MSAKSGKSCMTGSVRSCGNSVRLGTTHEVVLDALYERKRDKKTVRVLTVIVYVFCVSLAAIMLSLYYVFFWEPKDSALRKVAHTVEQPKSTTPMPTCFMPHTGRGDTTINETIKNITNEVVSDEEIMLNDEEISAESTPAPEFNYTTAFDVKDITTTYDTQDAYIPDDSGAVHNT